MLRLAATTVAMQGALNQAGQAPQPPARQERYWTTNWNFRDIDAGKLASRLNAVGIDLGVKLSGTATVEFVVGVPLTALRNGAAYRFDGTISSPRLSVDGVQFRDFRGLLRYRDGVAVLRELRSEIAGPGVTQPGRIDGNATMQLVPRGDLQSSLKLEEISVAPIAALVEKFARPGQAPWVDGGRVSGKVDLRVAVDSIANIAEYELAGNVTSRAVSVAGLPPADVAIGEVKITDGTLQLNAIDLNVAGFGPDNSSADLLGNAMVPLDGSGEFRFDLSGDDVPTEIVAQLARRTESPTGPGLIEGKLDFQAQGQGVLNDTLASSTWNVDAQLASPGLKVAGVELGLIEHDLTVTPQELSLRPRTTAQSRPPSMQIGEVDCRYEIREDVLKIAQLDAGLFGGRVRGSANLSWLESGNHELVVDFSDMRPAFTAQQLAPFDSTITATLAGQVDWQVPANSVDQPAAHQGQANVSASEIKIGDVAVGGIEIAFSADRGELALRADGNLFDGKVTVAAAADADEGDRWSDLRSRVRATELHFDRLSFPAVLAAARTRQFPLEGRVSGDLVADFSTAETGAATSLPPTAVTLRFSQLKYAGQLLSNRASLSGTFNGRRFRLRSLSGDYASGIVRASGTLDLFDANGFFVPSADLNVSASRVALRRGLWFLGDLVDNYDGRASISARVGGVGTTLRIRGSVDGRDLVFYGLPLGVAHSGIAGEADWSRRTWQVKFPSVHSAVGGGRLEGELALSSARRGGGGVDLASRWSTRRVDFFQITSQLGRPRSLAHGEITGDASIGGRSISSFEDLKGRFRFRLGQTQGAALPGLIRAGRFLGPLSLATEQFDNGEAIGYVGGGAVIFDEFWVGSDSALVQADGKYFLRSGKIDFNVLIATGDYRDIAAGFAELAEEYALRALLPASALLDLTELLRDRTLVLRVLGTTRNPIVRLQPIETFREEAARVLLREGQRLIISGISAGAIDGISN